MQEDVVICKKCGVTMPVRSADKHMDETGHYEYILVSNGKLFPYITFPQGYYPS